MWVAEKNVRSLFLIFNLKTQKRVGMRSRNSTHSLCFANNSFYALTHSGACSRKLKLELNWNAIFFCLHKNAFLGGWKN